MSNLHSKSLEELQQLLGKRMNALRLLRNLDQRTTAKLAGLSVRTVLYLEEGRGATVNTLLRVLRALDALDGMELLAPRPAGKPLPLPRGPHAQERLQKRIDKKAKSGTKQAAGNSVK
jgi:transcriptional regulator with XRE-family HTH domain